MMRPCVVPCAFALLTGVVRAEDPQASLQASLEAKLARPFVKNVAWVMDYDEALRAAKLSRRLVFAYFTRSFQP